MWLFSYFDKIPGPTCLEMKISLSTISDQLKKLRQMSTNKNCSRIIHDVRQLLYFHHADAHAGNWKGKEAPKMFVMILKSCRSPISSVHHIHTIASIY